MPALKQEEAEEDMDNLICKALGHSWDGCVCTRCGRHRDEDHSWDGCVCRKCGARRDEEHLWEGLNCQECRPLAKKNRCRGCPVVYDSINTADLSTLCVKRCRRCGKIHTEKTHALVKAPGQCFELCSVCGYKTGPVHSWNGCTCSVCGAVRDEEHDWINEGCTERCGICGKTRENGDAHSWVRTGCTEKCGVCGKTRDSHEYHLLDLDERYGTCPKKAYRDETMACVNCEEDCDRYPVSRRAVYRCSRCGKKYTLPVLLREKTDGNEFIVDIGSSGAASQ